MLIPALYLSLLLKPEIPHEDEEEIVVCIPERRPKKSFLRFRHFELLSCQPGGDSVIPEYFHKSLRFLRN